MKSILIIDTPKNCPDCQLMADGWCYGIPSREEVQGKIKYLKRPSWCPLRPLPERLEGELQNSHPLSVYSQGMRDGFNMCLEEITE